MLHYDPRPGKSVYYATMPVYNKYNNRVIKMPVKGGFEHNYWRRRITYEKGKTNNLYNLSLIKSKKDN